jgi:hypothetical protein
VACSRVTFTFTFSPVSMAYKRVPSFLHFLQIFPCNKFWFPSHKISSGSSVVIATRYGPDGAMIESRWEAIFSAPVQICHGAHPASCIMGTVSLHWVKRSGHSVDYRSPPIAEVKEILELYLYSPSRPLFCVLE